ncbi:MAG: ATP-binding protein [Janthinobacterium lividum]
MSTTTTPTPIRFLGIRQAEEIGPATALLRARLEERLNLPDYRGDTKPVVLTLNLVQRLALMASLCQTSPRSIDAAQAQFARLSTTFHDTVFSRNEYQALFSALLKLRYPAATEWETPTVRDRIINYEMLHGLEYLSQPDHLDAWLLNTATGLRPDAAGQVPAVNLLVGTYEGDMPATLALNSTDVTNTQILIAGSTGSGKSNLLAVLLQQLRGATVETAFPINFLLFDYKGEFSDPANAAWLDQFEVTDDCLLDPVQHPLPFSPFKNFEGKPQNAINLYATELSEAFKALDRASISANMANNLTQAVITAYKHTAGLPISFPLIEKYYAAQLPPKDAAKIDSVRSILQQLIRSKLFRDTDDVDLIHRSFIVKMDGFPKDGAVAKAIVYFTISKLNNLYEELPKQRVSGGVVELRHFTIIDEAHYMLDFDNRPLRNLIAVGRNKGLSIILATQNMESFKSEYFDFYANAQYPLLMKQQTINDKIVKDLFGVASGSEFNEIKQAISDLGKGELLIKNATAAALGMGKKYKKIKVTHLI